MTNIQKYKQFLNEEAESKNEFKVQALLVLSKEYENLKSDILSSIRAVEGVTRVHVDQSVERVYYEISKVTVKVNTNPFGVAPLALIFNQIRQEILRIKGIKRFTYISKPERLQ